MKTTSLMSSDTRERKSTNSSVLSAIPSYKQHTEVNKLISALRNPFLQTTHRSQQTHQCSPQSLPTNNTQKSTNSSVLSAIPSYKQHTEVNKLISALCNPFLQTTHRSQQTHQCSLQSLPTNNTPKKTNSTVSNICYNISQKYIQK